MAAVSRENWVERIRDPKIECMSRDEMAALQSRRLVEVVNRVYNNVEFYRKKMQDMGIEPGDIKSIAAGRVAERMPRFVLDNSLDAWGIGRELPEFAKETFNEMWKKGLKAD